MRMVFWWVGVLWRSFKPFPLVFPRCSAKKEQQNLRPPASPKSIKGSLGGSLNAGWMASQRATGQKDCHKIHIGFITGIAEGKNMGPQNKIHWIIIIITTIFFQHLHKSWGGNREYSHRTFRISGCSSPECRLPWRPWIAALAPLQGWADAMVSSTWRDAKGRCGWKTSQTYGKS